VALLEVGLFAMNALAGGDGEVCAVFRRSLYLRFAARRYACIGDRSLGRGPLNALVSDWSALASLAPGERFGLSTSGAKLWRPETLVRCANGTRLAARLDTLARAAVGRAAREGLGGAITGGSSPLLGYAQPALAALDRWLAGSRHDPVPPQTETLIGLGPGLTPSGDDYLGGMLVALHSFDRADFAARLWRWLAARLRERTSAISGAHLAAAAAGEAHETLHACLHDLLGTRAPRWKDRFAQLERVGHCSGWDALAGALAVARAAR
jgi:hypothetical protein